jgi:hypothetical protein
MKQKIQNHMKHTSKMTQFIVASMTVAILCGSVSNIQASGKTTDPAGAPSTGGAGGGGGTSTGGGGGGGKSTTPISPAPTPILVAPLTFVCVPDVSGNVPVCTGSYQIDPYYPTLSLLTLKVSASSVNVPDGTVLYVAINLIGYGYLATSNTILIAGQAGSLTLSGYIVPGATIQSVVITDANGAIIAAGN